MRDLRETLSLRRGVTTYEYRDPDDGVRRLGKSLRGCGDEDAARVVGSSGLRDVQTNVAGEASSRWDESGPVLVKLSSIDEVVESIAKTTDSWLQIDSLAGVALESADDDATVRFDLRGRTILHESAVKFMTHEEIALVDSRRYEPVRSSVRGPTLRRGSSEDESDQNASTVDDARSRLPVVAGCLPDADDAESVRLDLLGEPLRLRPVAVDAPASLDTEAKSLRRDATGRYPRWNWFRGVDMQQRRLDLEQEWQELGSRVSREASGQKRGRVDANSVFIGELSSTSTEGLSWHEIEQLAEMR